jgi:hypothetical protein
MDKKLRIRESKDNAQVLLLKMMPLLFMILLFMMASSIGISTGGPIGSGID